MSDNNLVVGIADMKIARLQGTLITYALGSCIGICLLDPGVKLASMVHIMLPGAVGNVDNLYKYADTGIAETVRKMETLGAKKVRMVAKIAGGAKMFNIPGEGAFGNIGTRNVEAVTEALRKAGIVLRGKDVGGTIARTMLFDVETGQATIKVYGQIEKVI